ncbi:hypothetical protein ACIPT3_02260 [Streptomyces diastaticus]|uniref:hypothetical protein n=1 Tax=Streptomyces diastaticus TaxID=1956 RepID=UPI0037FAD924
MAELFFRVQSAGFGRTLEVQLREKRAIGSRVLLDTLVRPEEFPTATDAIESAKARLRAAYMTDEKGRTAYRAALKMTGDHSL